MLTARARRAQLFIHMLGYSTHFGHMECLKLIATSRYSEKRIGYLALMLLLDEKQEVLMLVTNSLQADLKDSNHFVVAQALCAVANISSMEMSADVAPDVVSGVNRSWGDRHRRGSGRGIGGKWLAGHCRKRGIGRGIGCKWVVGAPPQT